MTVRLNGYLRCDSLAQAEKIRAALPDHVRLTRAELGCLSFEITESDDPLVWTVSESFQDPAAFKAHQARTAASDWARASAGVQRDFQIEGLA